MSSNKFQVLITIHGVLLKYCTEKLKKLYVKYTHSLIHTHTHTHTYIYIILKMLRFFYIDCK